MKQATFISHEIAVEVFCKDCDEDVEIIFETIEVRPSSFEEECYQCGTEIQAKIYY